MTIVLHYQTADLVVPNTMYTYQKHVISEESTHSLTIDLPTDPRGTAPGSGSAFITPGPPYCPRATRGAVTLMGDSVVALLGDEVNHNGNHLWLWGRRGAEGTLTGTFLCTDYSGHGSRYRGSFVASPPS